MDLNFDADITSVRLSALPVFAMSVRDTPHKRHTDSLVTSMWLRHDVR